MYAAPHISFKATLSGKPYHRRERAAFCLVRAFMAPSPPPLLPSIRLDPSPHLRLTTTSHTIHTLHYHITTTTHNTITTSPLKTPPHTPHTPHTTHYTHTLHTLHTPPGTPTCTPTPPLWVSPWTRTASSGGSPRCATRGPPGPPLSPAFATSSPNRWGGRPRGCSVCDAECGRVQCVMQCGVCSEAYQTGSNVYR